MRRLVAWGMLGLLLVLAGCSRPAAETALQVDPLADAEAKLLSVAIAEDATVRVGHDGKGRLVALLSMIEGAPDYVQQAGASLGLAMVAEIFQAAPEITGVWAMGQWNTSLQLAFFDRQSFTKAGTKQYQGDWKIYAEGDWKQLSREAWTFRERFSTDYKRDLFKTVDQHVRTALGSRVVSVTEQDSSLERTGVKVVLRGLPAGGRDAAMEEWARVAVLVTGRFYENRYGASLEELVWVDQSGKMLFRSEANYKEYEKWWAGGMRPGRWFIHGNPFDGTAKVESARYMEPRLTSRERAASLARLAPVSPALKKTVADAGASILFAGGQGEKATLLVLMDSPEKKLQPRDTWSRQMEFALRVMESQTGEVWVVSRHGGGGTVAYLNRLNYDAIRYPDKQLPPVTPELWPFVTTLYGES